MNRHVGASFTLSVLVVVFFAVVLYQPDRPHPTPSTGEAKPKTSASKPVASSRFVPDQTPGTPIFGDSGESAVARNGGERRSGAVAAASAPKRDEPGPEFTRVQRSSLTTGTPLASAPDATVEPDTEPMRQAERSAFTQVGDGETLTDVAVRVYGSTNAARTLWLANRDIIDNGNAPLRRGTLLRTP